MADRIQHRRDTKANWEQYNPVLLEGEIGLVMDDPNLYKVGDGTNAWNDLPFRGFDGTIVHELGDSENAVMSQKIMTDYITILKGNSILAVSNVPNPILTFDELKIIIGSGIYMVSFESGSYIQFLNKTIDFSDKTDDIYIAYVEVPLDFFTKRQIITGESYEIKYGKFQEYGDKNLPLNYIVVATCCYGYMYSVFLHPYLIRNILNNIENIEDTTNKLNDRLLSVSTITDSLFKVIGTKLYIHNQDVSKDKVWGSSDEGPVLEDIEYPNWWSKNELVQVTPGDILKIYNCLQVLETYGYVGYDSDGNPFDGKTGVVRIYAGNVKNGYNEYVIPDNCYYVGLTFQIDKENVEDSNIYYTINEDVLLTNSFIDKIKTIISDNKESISNASYYHKGASPKTFNKLPCIITAGQSNAEGRCPYEEIPVEIKNAMPIENCHYVKNSENDPFESLNITDMWAFDLIVYYNMAVTNKQEMYVIKWAVGGTSIDMEGATNMHWTADYEEVIRDGQTSLLRNLENEIRNHLASDGNKFDIRAILWHQGEGDGGESVTNRDEVASRYYDNLKNMIAYIRGIVGNETLPFITGTISKNSISYNQKIQDAQEKLAKEDPNFYLIDMSGATLRDTWHFDSESAIYFGEMAFNCLIDAGVVNAEHLSPIKPW